MEPEPAGSRIRPPARLPTRNGTGLPSGGTVLVDLSRPEESKAVVEAFCRLGWQAQENSLILAALVGGYELVVTDALDSLATFLNEIHPEPTAGIADGPIVFVLSDPDEDSVRAAWMAGADNVVWRQFDPEDPLQSVGFL